MDKRKIAVVAGSLPLAESKKLIDESEPKRKIVVVGTFDNERMKDLKEVMQEIRDAGHEITYLQDPAEAENYKSNGYEFFDLSDIDKPKEPIYFDESKMGKLLFDKADEFLTIHRMIPGPKKPQRILGYYNPETDKLQGRNEPCRCRSGKKFKHCCINKTKEK